MRFESAAAIAALYEDRTSAVPRLDRAAAIAARACLERNGCTMVAGAVAAVPGEKIGFIISMNELGGAALRSDGFYGPYFRGDDGTYVPNAIGVWTPKG